jgi:hypothetical protein
MEISWLIGIVIKLKSQEPYFAYYKLKEYEDFKVENVLLDMRNQTLGIHVGKLG